MATTNPQSELTELEAKLMCMTKTGGHVLQELLKFLSKNSDISTTVEPGKSLSAILQSLPKHIIDKLKPLNWPDNKDKFFVARRNFQPDIDINKLDITPMCYILLNIPAYPTCKDHYEQQHTPINHNPLSVCTNASTCCSCCLNCFVCHDKCKYANANINEIKKSRNLDSHCTPKEYDDIDIDIAKHPNGPVAVKWNTYVKTYADAILFIVESLHNDLFIEDKVYELIKLEINMILTLKKDVYFSQFFPNGINHLLRPRYVSIHNISLTFDVSTNQFQELKRASDLKSPESIAFRQKFQVFAQDELQKILHLNDDSCKIKLNEIHFEKCERKVSSILATIHIKPVDNVIPENYESSVSEESIALIDALTKRMQESLITRVDSRISVTCIGYRFKSIHIHFEITLVNVEILTDIQISNIHSECQEILRSPEMISVFENHNLENEKITVTFPETVSRDDLLLGFTIYNYADKNEDAIKKNLLKIERNIYEKICNSQMSTHLRREEFVLQDTYKICLSGAPGVGKTSIFQCVQQLTKKDVRKTSSGGIDYLEYRLPGLDAKIELYDTSIEMTDHSYYYRGAACLLLVYDITDRDSLQAIIKIKDAFTELCPHAKLVLLRNKVDKKLKSVEKEEQDSYIREQAPELWENLSRTNDTSAARNFGVKKFFMKDLKEVLRLEHTESNLKVTASSWEFS